MLTVRPSPEQREQLLWIFQNVAKTLPGETFEQWGERARLHVAVIPSAEDGVPPFPVIKFYLEVRDPCPEMQGTNVIDGWSQVFSDGDWDDADPPALELIP